MVAAPIFDLNAGSTCDRSVVNAYVSPEPSVRWTGTTLVDGSFTPGLSFWMAGSFQAVIFPVNVSARTVPLSFRLLGTPWT